MPQRVGPPVPSLASGDAGRGRGLDGADFDGGGAVLDDGAAFAADGFAGADFAGADFDGADFDGADFDGADFDGADGFDPVGFDADGFDADGFDADGFDADDFDADGFDGALMGDGLDVLAAGFFGAGAGVFFVGI